MKWLDSYKKNRKLIGYGKKLGAWADVEICPYDFDRIVEIIEGAEWGVRGHCPICDSCPSYIDDGVKYHGHEKDCPYSED